MEELTKAERRAASQHAYYMKIREKKLAAAKERYATLKKSESKPYAPHIPKDAPTYEQLLEYRNRTLESKRKYYRSKHPEKIPEVTQPPEEIPEAS